MTSVRQEAINLINKMPEDKLNAVMQILNGVNSLLDNTKPSSEKLELAEKSYQLLEKMRRKADDIDYDKELAEYRDKKYSLWTF